MLREPPPKEITFNESSMFQRNICGECISCADSEAKIWIKCMYVNSLHPKDLQAELEGGKNSSPLSSTSSPLSSTSFERPQDEGEGKEEPREEGKVERIFIAIINININNIINMWKTSRRVWRKRGAERRRESGRLVPARATATGLDIWRYLKLVENMNFEML